MTDDFTVARLVEPPIAITAREGLLIAVYPDSVVIAIGPDGEPSETLTIPHALVGCVGRTLMDIAAREDERHV